MSNPDFELQPSIRPPRNALDGECATRNWPMPVTKPWTPAPQEPLELAQRIAQAWERVFG
jgi:hypothetical protein